jgi:hypothetical protein
LTCSGGSVAPPEEAINYLIQADERGDIRWKKFAAACADK